MTVWQMQELTNQGRKKQSLDFRINEVLDPEAESRIKLLLKNVARSSSRDFNEKASKKSAEISLLKAPPGQTCPRLITRQ